MSSIGPRFYGNDLAKFNVQAVYGAISSIRYFRRQRRPCYSGSLLTYMVYCITRAMNACVKIKVPTSTRNTHQKVSTFFRTTHLAHVCFIFLPDAWTRQNVELSPCYSDNCVSTPALWTRCGHAWTVDKAGSSKAGKPAG